MRRSMLTAGVATVPITVGTATGTSNEANGNALFVSATNPATGDGTLTSVTANLTVPAGTFTIAFFTCTSSLVVRAVSADLTAVNGSNAYSVSIAVQTGDYIGMWISNSARFDVTAKYLASGSGYYRAAGNFSKPTASQNLAPNMGFIVSSRTLNLGGTS